MKATSLLVALLATCACLAAPARAHDEDLRSAKPRIGTISDEVARQRLQAAGVQQATVVKRERNLIILQGTVNGSPVTLHMNAQSGDVVDPREPTRKIAVPGTQALRPMIAAPQVPVARERLSDPELMRNAAQSR
jgi:hypothetical protein